jgi:hypothetical protein
MALLGKVAATIFIAICAFFGFGPDEWVRLVMPGPDTNLALLVARIVFLVLGAAVLGLFLYQEVIGWLPWSKPIPLPEAAREAYDKMQGTLWRLAADKWHGNPSERLDFFASYLAQHAQLLGCAPPSKMLLPIPAEELRSGTFRNGGDVFRKHLESTDTYVGMAIARSEFKKALKRMHDAK